MPLDTRVDHIVANPAEDPDADWVEVRRMEVYRALGKIVYGLRLGEVQAWERKPMPNVPNRPAGTVTVAFTRTRALVDFLPLDYPERAAERLANPGWEIVEQ